MNEEEKFPMVVFKFELKSHNEQESAENDNEKAKNGKSYFYEQFIPYSVPTLVENDLLSAHEEVLLSKYSGERGDDKKLEIPLPEGYENRADWSNQNGEYEEICLFDYIADYVFVTELAKSSEEGGKSDDEKKNVRLGIFTELLKLKFFQFKVDFSILYNIFYDKRLFGNISGDIDSYADIVFAIVQRNLSDSDSEKATLTREKIKEDLQSNSEKLIKSVCKKTYKDIQDELEKIYLTNISDGLLNTLINSIIKAGGKYSKKYKANRDGCFCIVKNGEKYYFSLSGIYQTERNFPKNFTDTIATELKKSLNAKCEFCPVSSSMKSYGIRTELGFMNFHYPRKIDDFFSDIHSFPYCSELQTLFACCERKTFVKTQNPLPIKIHCRWSPCERCRPAVFEEIQRHDSFEYIALAKDFSTFKKLVEIGKTEELKLWRLTRD